MERSENTVKTNTYNIITPEEVLAELNADFLDVNFCRHYIIEKLHQGKAQCPHCKNKITDETTAKNFIAMRRCQCKSCKRWFTAMTGTFLQGSQLNAKEIILLMLLIGCQINIKEIARALSIHPDTVKLWQKKINALRRTNGRRIFNS